MHVNVELVFYSGKDPTDDYLEGMMNNAPGPIDFTGFLTLFEEILQSTDAENVIKDAFGCFDENNEGVINEARLRELLVTMGDRFTNEEVCACNDFNILTDRRVRFSCV